MMEKGKIGNKGKQQQNTRLRWAAVAGAELAQA